MLHRGPLEDALHRPPDDHQEGTRRRTETQTTLVQKSFSTENRTVELCGGWLLRSRQVQKIARDARKSLAAQVKLMFLGHFACRQCIPALPAGCGGNSRTRSLVFKRFRRWAEKKLSRSSWSPPSGFPWRVGTFSRNALRQFHSFSLVRRFTRTQISCSPRETRTHLRDISRGHKLGGCTQFGCAPRLWAGFPSAPEDRERFPNGTRPFSGCTGHCATKAALLCGYSKNCASAHCGSSAHMLFAECDPFCALQAYFEGVKASLSLFLHRATSTSSLWTA